MSVTAAKQLSLFLENKPGVLAKLCRAMAGEGISLKGIAVSDSVDHAVVRLVVDKPAKACRLFEDHNLLVIENDVVAVGIPDRPGELGKIAARLSRAGLNINYLYGSSPDSSDSGTIFLGVGAPVKKVVKLLRGG